MKKRVLSVFLCLCMVVGMVSILAMPAQAYTTGDDYPYKTSDYWYCYNNYGAAGTMDSWGFCRRQCTSFVAHCLMTRNGVTNRPFIGNAKSWGVNARAAGYTVDQNPAVGAVAYWDAGNYGHVAWVSVVNGDTVTIEEYNYNSYGLGYGAWNQDTLPRRRNGVNDRPSGYIHVKDIGGTSTPPQPTVPSYPSINFGTGFYAVIESSLGGGKRFALANASDGNYTTYGNVQIESYDWINPRQVWYFTWDNSSGAYEIRNEYDGRCLDVNNGSDVRFTNIGVWERNNTMPQRWKLVREPASQNVYFNMLPCCTSQFVADVENANAVAGTNVRIDQRWYNDAQKFSIAKLEGQWAYSKPSKPSTPNFENIYATQELTVIPWSSVRASGYYDSREYEFNLYNKTTGRYVVSGRRTSSTSYSAALPAGNYRAEVRAINTKYANYTSSWKTKDFTVAATSSYKVTTDANPLAGGTVTGGGSYAGGASATLKAVPNSGYAFKEWSESGRTVSTNPSYTFTVDSNRALTAVFEKEQGPILTQSYIITVKANPAESGAVSGDGVYQVGTDVTVTAKPKDGYEFKGWTEHGQTVSTSTSYSFTINASRDFVAVFEKKQAVQLKLTAPVASSITYGQKLSASTLSGGTATDPSGNVVSGTWAWKTPDTVPTGSRYQAVFIPSQNEAYKTPNPMGVSVPVDPAIPDIILSVPVSCAAGDTANISTAVRNPHNTALSNLPSVNLSYRIGGKDYRISGGKLTVPAGTAAGTTITITASTNANSKYQATQKTATIVVSGSLDSCANGHSWGAWSTLSAPTCTQAGQQVRTCIKCGAQDVEAVAARGHNYQKSGEYSVCTNCGDTIDSGNSSNVSGLDNFIQANTYYNGLFRDVSANAWYVDNVSSAYQLGLMKGRAAGVFSPENNVTFAETITLAARIHSIYTYGKENFESYDGGNWYDPYVNYARTNGIATENYNYNRPATREEFVHILVEALPREAIAGNSGRVSNFADTSSIVYSGDVEVLYKAGVIGGVDVGSLTYFMPGKSVTRAEAAAIITRMVQPGLRF